MNFANVRNNTILDFNSKYLDKDIIRVETSDEIYQAYKEDRNKVIYQDGVIILDPEYQAKQAQARKEVFTKDFFKTTLGYVRRKVSMATGETKDFLSDLLPTISMGVQMGQPVSIITYKEPDFTTDEIDWVALQEVKTVTAQFVQECFLQLSNDFKPVESEPDVDNSEPDVDNSEPTDEENSVVEDVTEGEPVDNTEG